MEILKQKFEIERVKKEEKRQQKLNGGMEKRQRAFVNGHMEARLLTVEQASEYLNLHPQTVYCMARLGELPIIRFGRAVRFDKVELDLWIKRKIDENHEKLLPWQIDRC